MKTKIPYSPPSMEVVKLKVSSCICQQSQQQLVNQMMLFDTFTYDEGVWDPDSEWESIRGGY